MRRGVGQDAGLDVAPEQIVGRLQGLDRQYRAKLGHLGGVEVALGQLASQRTHDS